jgi:hypothetical protein
MELQILRNGFNSHLDLINMLVSTKRIKVSNKSFLRINNIKLVKVLFKIESGYDFWQGLFFINWLIIYKLKILDCLQIPQLTSLIFRSTFKNKLVKTKIHKFKGFFIILYFIMELELFQLLSSRFFIKNIKKQELSRGWSFCVANNTPLHLYMAYDFFLFNFIHLIPGITIYNIVNSWKSVKPQNWRLLKYKHWIKYVNSKITEESRFEYYWLLLEHSHKIYFKLSCSFSIPFKLFNFKKKNFTLWYTRVLLFRLLGYPAVWNYKHLQLLHIISFYNASAVDSELAEVHLNVLEQKGGLKLVQDYRSILLIKSLSRLIKLYYNSVITELDIKLLWSLVIRYNIDLSYIIRYKIFKKNLFCFFKLWAKNNKIN